MSTRLTDHIVRQWTFLVMIYTLPLLVLIYTIPLPMMIYTLPLPVMIYTYTLPLGNIIFRPPSKVHMESLTCATILMRAVHRKTRQALASRNTC